MTVEAFPVPFGEDAPMTRSAIPAAVMWSYFGFGAVLVTSIVAALSRDDWRVNGWDRLVRLGPVFYGAPLTGFGIEHFTQTNAIAALIPRWMPFPLFWTYVIGAGFILGGFSLVSRVLARWSAPTIAVTFFFFVALMDVPAFARNPGDRFGLVLALRELAFSAGALACAATLWRDALPRASMTAAAIARWVVAVAALFYSVEQFLYTANVPGIPLRPLTPAYIPGRAYWPYFMATAFAIAGLFLIADRRTRAAATWLGASVLVVELAVYVPIAIVQRASLVGFNFLADTLMFCGAVLLVAGAMPHEARE